MASYWERRRREAQRRAFERSFGVRLPTGDTEASLADAEARRVAAGRRAEAEARVGATGPRARAEEMLPSRDLFGSEGVGRDFRVEPRTAEEQQRTRDLAEFVLFGPERGSVAGGEAGRLERFVRDWGLSEQEFRLAGERAGEGRAGAAAGWAALGLAGAVPFFGDVAQGVGRAGRVASQAADVGRGVEATEQTTKWANAWRRNATDDWRAPDISESVGKDLSSGSMEFTIPRAKLESIPEQRRETAEIFHRQQFDVEPQRIKSQFFDRAVDASNGIPIYRGLSASTIDEAAKYANQFLSGDYHIGVGFNGMGSYFGVDPRTALQYASMSSPDFRAGRPGAIVRGIIPRSALIFDDSLNSNLTRSILTSFSRSPFDDLGMYLASIGYDGQRVVRGGDEYIVVYNRGILKMDDSVYSVPEGLRPQKEEGGWEGMSQILKNLYGEDFVR